MTRILLGQLGSNGDCLYATIIARQIKHDFPGCHLTWAVGSFARPVLENNPFIDRIWQIQVRNWTEMDSAWSMFEREALRLQAAGVYDRVFPTQIAPGAWANFDGTIRPSILRSYPKPIAVPIENIIRLTEEEEARVDRWYAQSRASEASFTVLFECSSKSGQSFMTPSIAVAVAERVLAQRPSARVIISTLDRVTSDHKGITWAGDLSMRETLRLTHYVDLFVGCGSGLTVVATSEGAKPSLPNIQILSRRTSVYASFRHDFEYYGKPADHFLEITSEDADQISGAVLSAMTDGFAAARAQFDDPVPLNFDWYLMLIDQGLVRSGQYLEAAHSLKVTAERYGAQPQLENFARSLVTPFLEHDPRSGFVEWQPVVERYRELFA